jgi:hypothetical protein
MKEFHEKATRRHFATKNTEENFGCMLLGTHNVQRC